MPPPRPLGDDFSVRPFVAGAIYGLRSFQVTPDFHLKAVSYDYLWSPGLNVAACARNQDNYAINASQIDSGTNGETFELSFRGSQKPAIEWDDVRKKLILHVLSYQMLPDTPETRHQVAQLDCSCGFYGYFDATAADTYHRPGHVYGVIKGYGRVTVGDRGFRAEKAELVALIREGGSFKFSQSISAYPDIPTFDTILQALAKFPLSTPLALERSKAAPGVQPPTTFTPDDELKPFHPPRRFPKIW